VRDVDASAGGGLRRHLISLSDVDTSELDRLVGTSVEYAAGGWGGRPLDGAVVGVYFRRTSTRTRTAFSVAALRLGAQIVAYGPDDLQLNTGETVEDTAKVFAGMLDGLVARTAGPTTELRALADQGTMSVVNAMCAVEHPTQALADLTTMTRKFGRLEGLRVVYVGEGNSTAVALALALSRYPGVRLELRTPLGYGLDPETTLRVKEYAAVSGAAVEERHDLGELPGDADVVYTTRWQTTGSSKADARWRQAFEPFRVDGAVMAACPGAVFMHDLPAHRGEEVTAEVLDGARSIAFDQANNKLYSAMAALKWCIAR